MNTNVQKVVDALRSGEYKQTQHGLHDEVGYCCLGVACDIYRKETGNGEWVSRDTDEDGDPLGFYDFVVRDPDYDESTNPWMNHAYYLPYPVMRWIGWADKKGAWPPFDSDSNLAALNDKGLSFLEIAQSIEDHAEALIKSRWEST